MYTVPKLEDYSPEALDRAVAELIAAIDDEAKNVKDEPGLKAFRDRWLARQSGIFTQLNEYWLTLAPPEHKRSVGQKVNILRPEIEPRVKEGQHSIASRDKIKKYRAEHSEEIEAARQEGYKRLLEKEKLDISLPGIQRPIGVKHPVLRVMDEIVAVFKAMGYSVGEGPEVETDYYNFESLNFPPNHPARDTQDTLFI